MLSTDWVTFDIVTVVTNSAIPQRFYNKNKIPSVSFKQKYKNQNEFLIMQ